VLWTDVSAAQRGVWSGWRRGFSGVTPVAAGIESLTPLLLPLLSSAFLWLQIRRALWGGLDLPTQLWLFTPRFYKLVRPGRFERVIYFSSGEPADDRERRDEWETLNRSHTVLAADDPTRLRLLDRHAHVYARFPAGVDAPPSLDQLACEVASM
jgi:hypothetical protein